VLNHAISAKRREIVDLLLGRGVDVDARDHGGLTALHAATGVEDMEVVKLLLAHGSNVNAGTGRDGDRGATALDIAASHGNSEIVELLLDAGAHINLAIHSSAFAGHGATMRLLIERGADVDLRAEDGDTPLHKALRGLISEYKYSYWVYRSYRDHGHELLEYFGFDGLGESDDPDRAEDVEVLNDTRQEVTDIVQLLVDRGADVNAIGEYGDTPLHVAVRAGHRPAAELLLTKGADVNVQNRGISIRWRHKKETAGQTPLLLALRTNRVDIVNLLIAEGAETNVQDDAGESPLLLAFQRAYGRASVPLRARYGYTLSEAERTALTAALHDSRRDIIRRLLNRGANVNLKDKEGSTPLHYAARQPDEELADLLLANGADPNALDASGKTPLHHAAREDSDIVRVLLKYGARADVTDKDGDTPVHEAALRGRVEIVELLLAHGADAGIRNNRGETPRDMAARRRHREVVRLLTGGAGGGGQGPGEPSER